MIDHCRKNASTLISLEEAKQKINLAITPIQKSDKVLLRKALGRILANDVIARVDLPGDTNSAMDGFAIHHQAINPPPFKLKLCGTSWAGNPWQETVPRDGCVRIFTGAVLPPGTDTVVIQEETEPQTTEIEFIHPIEPYDNVRQKGEDVKSGYSVLTSPHAISATDLGLLAAVGICELSVKRVLKVAFFSTGDELVALQQPLQPGQIYDSNRYLLNGLLKHPWLQTTDLGTLKDDKNLIKKRLLEACQTHDVILTTGGASVGDADYIKEIIADIGELNLWKIAMKPGKPLIFGKLDTSYFFGLPGNPVSVIATFQQVVLPALKKMVDHPLTDPLRYQAKALQDLNKAPGRMDFQRGVLTQDNEGGFYVRSVGPQGSHRLGTMSKANCFIVLSRESSGVKKGETVVVEPFNQYL